MTTLVMLAILLAGCIAFINLPVSDLPSIEHPHIQIYAGYPGAPSETVLNSVTIPLEKALTHVKGVKEMTSRSSPGSSSISLSFDFSKDMNEAIRDVQAALNHAESSLPNDLNPRPAYSLREDSQELMMWILLTSDYAGIGELHSYADAYILPRLSRLEGVSQVVVYGEEKSVWLRLNPELMAARRIGFNQVIDAVKQHTSQMPLGTLRTNSKRLSIEWPGTIEQAVDLENLTIGNTSVKIKDIGEISEESSEKSEFHFFNGEKTSLALILGIQKVNEGNTVAISGSVKGSPCIY